MVQTEQLLIQNLNYHRKMRSFYYKKARELFEKLLTNLKTYTDNSKYNSIFSLIEEYVETLESTCEYSHNATRGFKKNKVNSFKNDHNNGILEEEVVFVYMAEELLSSSIYFKNRFETNEHIELYVNMAKKQDNYKSNKNGFISNIIVNMEEDKKADQMEIIQISKLLNKRFRIADNIFSVLEKHYRKINNSNYQLT